MTMYTGHRFISYAVSQRNNGQDKDNNQVCIFPPLLLHPSTNYLLTFGNSHLIVNAMQSLSIWGEHGKGGVTYGCKQTRQARIRASIVSDIS
jgi:hypothetical protein